MSYEMPTKTIGVLLPMLSGFYMGEITATIRELAIKHRFNLVVIRVGHSGDYELPIAISNLDALLVVLHSASDSLIELAIKENIPVVSIGASYLPLQVEQVASHQGSGVEALYEQLVSQGHSSIGFCGDLNINDIRMRFKTYQSQLDKHQHTFHSLHLFNVSDATLSGGREAAAMLIERSATCTAVICATDYNAIGLIEKLKQFGKNVPNDIAVVGIDNVFLSEHYHPPITSVDQQLELLATNAIERLIERMNGAPYVSDVKTVNQKLIVRESCGNRFSDSKAKSESKAKSATENTIRQCLVGGMDRSPAEVFETIYSQAKSGFDSLLNLPGLYNTSMEWACYASLHRNRFSVSSVARKGASYSEHLMSGKSGSIRSFPPTDLDGYELPDHAIVTVMSIATGDQDRWELLAVVDDLQSTCSTSDYAMFNNYLDMLSLFIERDALLKTSQARHLHSQDLLNQLQVVSNTSNDGIWDWDFATNVLHWNSRLIDILCLGESSEKNAIDCDVLFSCIHPDDIGKLELGIVEHLLEGKPFKGNFRAKRLDGEYLWLQVSGSVLHDETGRPVRLIGSMTDVTQQHVSAEKIHKMAYYDSLTGVPNRRFITEKLQGHITQNQAEPLAVMMMDLNRFKLINDTYGHDVGDAVLCHIASKVEQVMRKGDFFARLGGDEFLFVCKVERAQQARMIANRILKQVETTLTHKQLELKSQGCLGIALYPQDGACFEELIKKADIAMYRAKQYRSRQVTFFSEEMVNSGQDRITIEQELIRALDNDKLEVWYQPQYDLKTNQAKGVEALVRWPSDNHTMISPAQFIPIAEDCGLIGRVGNFVLERVCRDLVANENLRYLSTVSINISPYQLSRKNFADEIIQTILMNGLPLTQFCLEITETCVIEDIEHAQQSLEKLHRAGVKVSLDDFGTGYSSLSLLKQLPLTEVKIDRSFMKELQHDSASQTLVESIITMCHAYGYIVTAEGVETKAQAELLKQFDCDLVQGFWYAKPLPLAQLPMLVEAKPNSETVE